ERTRGVLNQHIFRVDITTDEVDPKWFMFAVNHRLDVLIDKAQGGVGLRHVTRKEVDALAIPLPPLVQQRRIVAILSEQLAAVERARAAAEAQLEAAKALPMAYSRAVFTSPENKEWPCKPLRDLCEGDGQYGT